ncbi:hypothetical protein [Winogradskyella sediminis]|uniref:hypothetical protein n=1 Tax=Winogradskyella sediminis TaxID=1382466 RepID=UPI000E39F473|nr:hypothetical protein [Winogradskyella sediminis]REG87574.1 hypothetical protein C8N41_102413 [Winogradskyella sediminis]
MYKIIIRCLFLLLVSNVSNAQAWMTNLEIAQKLALTQNKMVLMVWEESTTYPYGVMANDENGKLVFIESLFESEVISPIVWEYFVPVIVSESQYADLYADIEGKRSNKYMNKFNDDSIKIMDVNGNIVNLTSHPEQFQNITTIINNYGVNTKFLSPELMGYRTEKDFYSAYYLASKYLDFSMYMSENNRSAFIDLGMLYLEEASNLVVAEPNEDQKALNQRVALLDLQQYFILKRPKKALRQLKKIQKDGIEPNNESFVAFLYYTAYSILEDETEVKLWKSKISSVNLKKAQMLINLNS